MIDLLMLAEPPRLERVMLQERPQPSQRFSRPYALQLRQLELDLAGLRRDRSAIERQLRNRRLSGEVQAELSAFDAVIVDVQSRLDALSSAETEDEEQMNETMDRMIKADSTRSNVMQKLDEIQSQNIGNEK